MAVSTLVHASAARHSVSGRCEHCLTTVSAEIDEATFRRGVGVWNEELTSAHMRSLMHLQPAEIRLHSVSEASQNQLQ